jgi:5-methylcytosine-specific restriction endonuclease McrA
MYLANLFRGSSAVERVAVRTHGILLRMPDRRTYNDRAEYLKVAVAKRRKAIRTKLIAYKGGCCILCGYNRCSDALDLHHLDAKTKEFGISSGGLTRSWTKVAAEADKCILVCANCHREIHAGAVQPEQVIARGNIG